VTAPSYGLAVIVQEHKLEQAQRDGCFQNT